MPFLEQTEQGGAHGLIGIAEAQSACVHAADVGGRFEEHDLGAFAGGGDRRAEAAGRGAVDNHVGFDGPGDGQGKQEP